MTRTRIRYQSYQRGIEILEKVIFILKVMVYQSYQRGIEIREFLRYVIK
ncbi:hypothetical protein SAMN05444280_1273 [Tangfeifania diversioriginum]|uniref:Uncharacterized protein n=1 Tax=Tangfeifania diversioriginum TaxID=1168035 RepID=A0A1M6LIN9_9BACT|nr:hypothetical protein SAMN05444280_1273 [Tangfeifania diversioriginum]